MEELRRRQRGSLLAVILFIASAYSEIHDREFQLVPIDKISYYGRRQGVLQICVPPAGGGRGVEWRKGNRTLKSDNRISIYASKNVKKYVKRLTRDVRKVYVLQIKPVLSEDEGDYACVDRSSSQQANFRIILVKTCDNKFFKCSMGDEVCVVNATVCDGNSDCDDASDEAVDAGCSYPPVPLNLRVVATSWHEVKLTWNGVKLAILYDVMNNDNEIISVSPEQTDVVFEGLRSGVSYTFSVRTKSYTGYSGFSKPLRVVTRLYNRLEIPRDVDGVYVDGLGIILCWGHLKRAVGYQIATDFPDGSNKTFDVSRPEFILRPVLANATYSFRVRQWTGFEYSKFSKQLTVDNTRPTQGESYEAVDVQVEKNTTVKLSWINSENEVKETNRDSSRLSCVTYVIDTCLRSPIYREWTTNETLVSDVIFLNYYNASRKKTVKKVSFKNYTIHYDKKHKAFLRYDSISCKVTSSDVLDFKIEDLVANAKYSYTVLIYLDGHVVGKYTEGNFTVSENDQVDTIMQNGTFFTGVVIYGISCFILIIALIVTFFIAYYCKWDKLMSDVAIKKARADNEKKEAEMGRLRPKLLSDSHLYLNDRKIQKVNIDS